LSVCVVRCSKPLHAIGFRALDVFGSLASGHDTPDSDVDLLVNLEPELRCFDLALFAEEVEAILGFHVDAVSAHAFSAAMPRIRAEAVAL
jgi:predicted nucleotidyltransferase